MDALSTLVQSVPDWQNRLDDLNSQIAQRQIELAQLTESRPPTRSVKNKGSTEPLRPNDKHENPFLEAEQSEEQRPAPTTSQPNNITSNNTTPAKAVSPNAPKLSTSPTGSAPKLPPLTSSNSSPGPLQRNSSQPTPYNKYASPILRKRKTESVASQGSAIPKYRTRSMIIVYYDSAVQDAFEELVKFVSASRNAMRKAKMTARMAEMRRMAELEAADDDSSDDDNKAGTGEDGGLGLIKPQYPRGNALQLQPRRLPSQRGDEGDFPMPRLKFKSTRQMGPSRDQFVSTRASDGMSPPGHSTFKAEPRRHTSGVTSLTAVYDELDKGLEWCQSMCEHAAHQFLRDGDCSHEITHIKKRLSDVRQKAANEVVRMGETQPIGELDLRAPLRDMGRRGRECRSMKSIQVRKSDSPSKDLVAGSMEVDDSGVDDMEPELTWTSAQDKVH